MKKAITLATVAFSMFILSACDSIDKPTPGDTLAGASSNELNPNGLPGDGSLGDAGLPERGINEAGFDPENINPEDIVSTIYFGFNQYAISGAERENVKKAAEFFKNNPNMKIILVGHTDWYGTEEYNTLLSDKRCKAVQEYMLAVGTDASKIETIARGEQGATIDVAKDSAEAKNDRRVDIVKQK